VSVSVRAAVIVAVAAAVAACAPPPDPYCTEVDDPSGRGIALCRDDHEQPVCDDPGGTARFERDAMGMVRLVGGAFAMCDEARQVVCLDRAVLPYCLPEPD
jgi:hypothetical protein